MRKILISKPGEFKYQESNYARKLAVIMIARLVKSKDKNDGSETVTLQCSVVAR
jgi:hypothetical protein